MKLATRVYVVTLILLMLAFAVSAQDRSERDPRNTAPTIGTGGPVGGPTGLFTVYDGQTLRKGEYTLSLALSNYDRDPGNVDITSVPISFQIGVSNKLELFIQTEAYRGVKVNAPRNLSGFYLPNSQLNIGGFLQSGPAMVLAPSGPTAGPFSNRAIFRPTGFGPFASYPYAGANAGTYGIQFPFFSGPLFGFPAGTNAQLGVTASTSGAADLFPGIGSVYGGILPGVVFSTTPLGGPGVGEGPVAFTLAPTYIADAPFINRTWGTSSFNSMDFGFKWRFNDVRESVGYGLTGYYRWYLDNADDFSGFNMMQRGAGPGGNKGDFGLTLFADARLAKWANLSGNVGYVYTSKTNGTVGGQKVTLLDRPDELQGAIGLDFPVNKYFQPILELRATRYVGGRTPNALERHPMDGLAGIRIFPRRWFGFSFAYRHNFNQQDADSFDEDPFTTSIVLPCNVPGTACVPITINNTISGVPPGFRTSSDPHGYMAQFFIGRRDKRQAEIENLPPSVNSVTISDTTITLPCPPGTVSRSGACNDSRTVTVVTSASDPENDVLTYNYTVSGGRIVGTGANVEWDLSEATPGTYTITTGVDDGCGVCGKTDTQTITIAECPDCGPVCPTCPPISISGPAGVTNPGDTMTFTASVSGDVTYNWSVSAGTIESGQGTPSITVRTTEDMAGSNVTATVSIGGIDTPNCAPCPSEATETAGVATVPEATLIDEFGPAVPDDIKARVDNFYTQLNNNPTARGYIINYGTAAEIRRRRAQIDSAISFRGFDRSRITYIDGPNMGTGINTKFYLVPAGANEPQP